MGVQKPSTQREMVEQMWYCLLGTNGGGMVDAVKKEKEHIKNVERKLDEYIANRWNTCPVRRSKAEIAGAWATRVATISAIIALVLKFLEII